MKKYVMALDQGTTSSRCILFDKSGHMRSVVQREFTQIYPKPGWVEHDPLEIWSSQLSVAVEAMGKIGAAIEDIAAIGITNQRETTVCFSKKTGKPVYNAICWQCRRTADIIEQLKEDGFDSIIRERTGLVPDAYFSGTKIKWILDNVEGAREMAESGELLFGTVDTWLIWNLTKGKVFVTDYTNASRTMLFDIHKREWDEDILNRLGIPRSMLPQVKPSSCVYGYTDESVIGGVIPIAGAAGDQQAALFGQCCFEAGEAKNTYGTGCFLLMNTGDKAVASQNGLLTTIAASTEGEIRYALEGSVFVAGVERKVIPLQYVREKLGSGLLNIGTAAQPFYVMVHEEVVSVPVMHQPSQQVLCYKLFFSDVLSITNLLPEAVEYRIINAEGRVFACCALKSGEKRTVSSLKFRREEGLRISVRVVRSDFEFSDYEHSIFVTVRWRSHS